MKKFLTRFKMLCAIAVSFAFVLGSATVLDLAAPAQAAETPFTCTSDFYQVASGFMYEYSVATNTYTKMSGDGTTALSNLNAIGYNTGDNFIYGISGGALYQIGNDGSHGAAITVTGTAPQSTGGDFIAPNELLTASNGGAFALVNTSTHVGSTFTETGSTWAAYDLAYNPTNKTIYGMSGTTLYIGTINAAGTSVAVATKSVTGFPTATKTSDQWGASYVDSAGDAYFFDNTTFDLVEVSAANLATASPAAVSITQANSLAAPNDGASCPTASSPLAPTVTTAAATSVTLTTATLNGTVATGIPASSNILTGGIEICYSTSNTLVGGALSVSPVCAATTPSSLAVNTPATAVTLPVTGLSSGTTYYFQVEATNAFGLEAFGNVASLTTIAANHTVTFDSNGGTGTMANETNNAATALTTNAFTRAGFTFAGWNTAADGTGSAYADAASYPFTADNTLYAQWTALPNHTVTFNNNGGTGTMANEVDNVATNLATNTFARTGFSFTGWNTAANGAGTAYADAASYPFTADNTLYAQWTALPNHTVSFSSNGGSGTMASEVDNVATNLTTNTFTNPGNTFAGWATSSGGAVVYTDGASYPFTSDANLFAVWTPIPNKTVTFDPSGGSGSMANEVHNVPTALTANSFTKAGFSFAGWATSSGGPVVYTDSATYPFTVSNTLYAVWTALPNHTVTFSSNGGTGTMASEVDNVTTDLTTNTFTNPGNSFAGWATSSGGAVVYSDGASYPFTADASLFAKWTPLPNHTVTFNGAGGSGTMANEIDNVATNLSTNTFTRLGYTFAGWALSNGGSVVYADGASYPFSADTTLYASWTALPNHTVTFNNAGGSGTMANEVDNIPTNLTTNTFTRLGYTFAGWALSNGGSVVYADGASYPFSADTTLYASWTALPNHIVTFNSAGGTGTMANEVDNIPSPLTSNTFTRLGFTFAGWATSDGGAAVYADAASYPFNADDTLFAVWTAIPNKTVTFDSNGGTGSMPNEVDNIPTALTTNAFTRFGFTFAGWSTSSGGAVVYADGGTYPFDVDNTLYAQWTALPNHTVSFDANGGSGSMADEVDNVPTDLATNSFARAGYTFAGWATSSGGAVDYADGATYPFDVDNTLYAEWTAIPNKTVIFDSNGGTGSMADEVDNVPTALATDTFIRAGYTFSGWNTISDGSGTAYSDGASYSFATNQTMYAQWTVIPNKTLVFDPNGGLGTMASEVHNVPTNLTANAFTQAGFTFAGWNSLANGTGVAYADNASYPFATDGTLYAQWTAIPMTSVSFDPNGGTGTMADESANVPTPLTANAFTRAGYNFIGWNTAADGSGTSYPDGAVYAFGVDPTFYAQWTAKPILTFDPNGGTGTIAPLISDVPTNLPTTTITRPGYKFIGWNTAADGSGTEYAPGAIYPFAASGTLYAQYSKIILASTGVNPTPGLNLAMLLIGLGAVLMGVVALIGRKRGNRATS